MIKFQRVFDRYLNLRNRRDFSIDFSIFLIKFAFLNSHELKLYKKTIIDVYHKIN